MKRRNHTERRGVALLLILTLLAMFAVSVLAFMTITSNMADTAQNAAKAERYLPPTAKEDVNAALRNVLIGSNNERNPIGPFGVLENMYGDWKEYDIFDADGDSIYSDNFNGVPDNASENSSVQFEANIAIFPNRGYATLTPNIENYSWGDIKDYFERSGGVMTFKEAYFEDGDAQKDWNDFVAGSSTFVLEKVITNPTAPLYKNAGMVAPDAGNGQYWRDHYYMSAYDDESAQNNYKIWDNWHFRVELSDDMKRFVDEIDDVDAFNESTPLVTARLNRPAYSGSGVGGFTPMEAKDAQITPQMLGNDDIEAKLAEFGIEPPENNPGIPASASLRIPFAFWTNAAAPDLVPYRRGPTSTLSFRSMWAHLTDANYNAAQPELSGSRDWRYAWFDGGVWRTNPVAYGYQDGAYLEPPRLAAPYNAADRFTLFLANYKQAPFINSGDLSDELLDDRDETVTPSFHRPALFQTLANGYLSIYDQAYDAGGYSETARGALLTALLRKLTPRPLPLDHWNFDGGNDRLRYVNPENPVYNRVEGFANALATDVPAANPYDVDADGDGVREAIWIPSGLPIRVDENGTPYATMYAYTILDLDGRVNVNTAGNWDQLPNKFKNFNRYDEDGDVYSDASQPYNYVDELASYWAENLGGGVSTNSPFFNAESLAGRFGWNDDWNIPVSVAQRGEGRGTSNVLLYEALSKVFSRRSTDDVATLASNLLWRRNLSQRDNPTGRVDQSGLTWSLANKHDDKAQPGARFDGNETDDALGTRAQFFRFFGPTRLYDPNDADANESDATLAESKTIFPWRGKTTLDAGFYGMNADVVPGFDFADAGFRSYDPLGAQIYTYAPRYSRNPYWARQNGLGWADSPYSLPMLERLLRPFDADAAFLPSQLVDDLGMNSDLFDGANDDDSRTERLIAEAQRADARLALTTLSSDAPSPSLVFPDNKPLNEGDYRGGSFGFENLIRRNVRAELERVFKAKGLYADDDPNYGGDEINDYLQKSPNKEAFEDKVEEIAAYLIAMLPPEIAAGKKIDLNALARKNYWLDVEYDSNGRLVASADVAGSETHNVGLVKRMEMARGLYLVVMTLLFEDMNAGTLYNRELPFTEDMNGDGTPDAVDPGDLLHDYVEGSFDLLKFKADNRKDEKDVVSRQLLASRIAQWCVNVVDFADPDATMTPFFFDPTPFDGWWVDGNAWIEDPEGAALGYNRWEIGGNYTDGDGNARVNPGWASADPPEIRFLFAPRNGVPTEQMAAFFLSALNNSVDAQNDEKSGYLDADGNFPTVTTVDASGVETTTVEDRRANELIAEWSSREIKSVKDQSSDLGFRLAWGMERSDLVLTETLSFHDLGIADTDKAQDDADGDLDDTVDEESSDKHFDQVKRPEGSTYLELYCAANPNVPQSPELYDYDENTKQWRLRLTKKTPVYKDSLGRELETPVWRVAISDSRDPRGLNVAEDGADENAKKENARSKAAVYRKGRNGVLDWLASGKKEGSGPNERFPDNDFSFFSMQTRQFRNLPTPAELEVASIADLDLYQGFDEANNKAKEPTAGTFLADWKAFNLRASNILGAAFAESQDSRVDSVNGKRADAWSLREVELDRVLWFNKAEGDSASEDTKLGTAGKYPDALRTFCNAEDEIVYLAPNEYLVVGPDKKRALGSVAFNSTANEADDRRFGVKPLDSDSASWINIDNGRHGTDSLTNAGTENLSQAGKPAPNYKYMVAVANIGGRGLNISEPLWTATGVDPYYEDQENDKLDPAVLKDGKIDVRDVPFEMPKAWGDRGNEEEEFYDNKVANYPIVQDELFGVGTVPAYKSAFVQRVADPNRPYHPLMNPYITVDWNAMDLTVFTGECVEIDDLDGQNAVLFADEDDGGAKTDFDDKNQIELAENKAVWGAETTFPYADAFSSRQWGNSDQRMFVGGLRNDGKIRPNVWDRGVRLGDGGAAAGLEKPNDMTSALRGDGAGNKLPAMKWIPRHTLGFYNNRGPLGTWGVDADGNPAFTENTASAYYKGLNQTYSFAKTTTVATENLPYRAAPRTPFEHLVWNDAPYSAPFELALVPASAPGRFGLEFVRESEQFDLAKLYDVKREKERGVSLGSEGVFGFDKWYAKAENADDMGGLKERAGKIGPYLNFFASSKRPGEALNLCRALEFVYTPSLFLGTQKLAGEDENGNLITDGDGNPLFYSARREPGKVNLNTTNEAVWKALSPRSERVDKEAKLPGTPWRSDGSDDGFLDVRTTMTRTENVGDTDGDGTDDFEPVELSSPFVPFQPAHTTPLWGRLDQAPAPLPISATLAAQNETRSDDRGTNAAPLFDNLRERYATDGGEKVYTYQDASGNLQTTTDLDWLIANNIAYEEFKLLGKRNNLFEATAEMQRLSGTTTNRSNVFAVWTTVGYFEVERCNPGVNMPNVDPDGNPITLEQLINPNYKWYHYYQAIYPDGYTYGKELGSEFGETKRRRGFAIIDRSIPVDFRRGQSENYQDAILLQRVLD